MAAIKELEKVSLSLRIENGVDDDGNAVFKTKTFSKVKEDATPEAILAVVNGMKTVIANEVVASFVNEVSIVQEG